MAAALGEFNATVRTAYEKLLGQAAGYNRGRDEFERIHSEIASAMIGFAGEAGDDWQQGEVGQQYLEWMNLWIQATSISSAFERPRELTAPDPPLSAVITGLPREPGEAEATAERSAFADAPQQLVAGSAAKRRFEFSKGVSNKFWEVSQEGAEMTTRWGKIGTGGQSKTKVFDSPEKAVAEAAKAIASKVEEGYIEKQLPSAAIGPAASHRPTASSAWSALVDPEAMLGTVLPTASDRKRRLFAVACCRHVEDWLLGLFSGTGIDERLDDYRRAVETAERFADGEATAEELSGAYSDADDSAFCNEYLEDLTVEERRKACLGDDPGWPARLLSDEQCREMEAHPDPTAWFEASGLAGHLPGGVDPFRDVAEEDAVLVGETIGRQVLLLVRHYDWERHPGERAAQAALVRDIFGDPFPPPAFDPAWRAPNVTALAEIIYADRAFDRMAILADALEEAGCHDATLLGHCRGPGLHARGCWVLDLVLHLQ